MFGQEFYPTPKNVLAEMFQFLKVYELQTVLEPSAGKGDILDGLCKRLHSQKIDIDCIEIDENLQNLLRGKQYRVVHGDFLTYDTTKRYDLIIMNPPFASGERHLLKALDMQRRGGQIVCILNAETLKNPYSVLRKDLMAKLANFNAQVKYMQNAFVHAEKSTDVEIAIVHIDVPASGESIVLNNLQKAAETEKKGVEQKNLIYSDFIQGLLQNYSHLAALGASFIGEYCEIKEYLPKECKDLFELSIDKKISYYDKDFGVRAQNEYIKRLRRIFWKKLFDNKQFTEKLTSNLVSELYSQLNGLGDYEFSEWNIRRLWLEVMKNLSAAMEKTILSLFDEFSHEHYYAEHSSNIHYYNGWRTNKCWKVNNKIIMPIYAFDNYTTMYRPSYYRVAEKLTDMEKVFDVLNGEPIQFADVSFILDKAERENVTRNIEAKYFFVTFYKKGTAHITFKNLKLLKKFNIFASQRKNWLPPSYGKKHYADMSPEEQGAIDNFEGAINYEETMCNKDFYIIESQSALLMLEHAG